MIRRVCITGGAGFIFSNFADECLANDIDVVIVDNLRTGRAEFVPEGVTFIPADITADYDALIKAIDGCDWVVHGAANADVRHGPERVEFDLIQNGLGTLRVLEAARHVNCKKVFFASTASVYGDIDAEIIREDAPFPRQQSLYGASKVYGEGLVSSYVEAFDFTGVAGRWVQVVGPRYAHGMCIDLPRKILKNPSRLEILGDGKQCKSGVYVEDLTRAILTTMQHHDGDNGGFHAYNIGTDETFTVTEAADLICDLMNVSPVYEYTGRQNGGWIGDNPRILLDTTKIRSLGWKPEFTAPQAIAKTVAWLLSDECCYL